MGLEFVNDENISKDEIHEVFVGDEYETILNYYSKESIDKFLEICLLNVNWNYHTPKINSPILYLATSNEFKEDLDNISDNYEFILIDSQHGDIINKDIDKISKYFK